LPGTIHGDARIVLRFLQHDVHIPFFFDGPLLALRAIDEFGFVRDAENAPRGIFAPGERERRRGGERGCGRGGQREDG
jgi:hypothetical protein